LQLNNFGLGNMGIGDWGLGIGANPQSSKIKILNIHNINKIIFILNGSML